MLIGVPKEIKNHEYRVGLRPASVKELVLRGHQVVIENNAGAVVDFSNEVYIQAGASIAETAKQVYRDSEVIVKVKEPQHAECEMLREGQLLFAYLHLAADPKQAELLIQSGATCVAYETVTDNYGRLPLLAPMSEVAGRMSVQAGIHHLENTQGGRGLLLGGAPGVAPAKVLIIGGGVVGENAAKIAIGLGADVTILDSSIDRLRELERLFSGRARCVYSTAASIEEYALDSDLLIGAVLIPGGAAPKLVSRDLIAKMKKGSVMVDVAIDQGGCFETSRPTTHEEPTYRVDDVIHYCVANMPGGVARTATMALTNVNLPFLIQLADDPIAALRNNENIRSGLNIHKGKVTHQAVARALGYEYTDPVEALAI